MKASPFDHFVILRAGPMCASCAAKMKGAFERGEICTFEAGAALGEALHVECRVGIDLTVTVDTIGPCSVAVS